MVDDQNVSTKPKKSGVGTAVKVILVVIGAFIALIVALALFAISSTSEAVNVSKEFISAVQTGNTQGAYALTSEEFRAVTSHKDLKQVVDNVWDPRLPSTEPSISSREISVSSESSSASRVVAEWKNQDGSKIAFVVTLVETDSGWKVLNAETKELAPGEELNLDQQ